ncbi:MAG TPA: GntR family transcriptional regulator [Amycolatopsis sp.]|nr:GntR family transcriptional regulator [Amycolatopsis sp.]
MERKLRTPARGAHAHDQIRGDIIMGRWKPGERLQMNALAQHYATSTTVIREALTRLTGENFVVFEPNRGFFVPMLSMRELRDLTEVRCVTEKLGIELAIQRGDLGWESELIAAHHQLSRTPRRGADDPDHIAEAWAQAHATFHAKLIAACNVPVLIGFARQLSNSTELYRRWAAPSTAAESRDVENEHAEILAATLARDAELAAELLRRHYETTIDVVFASGLVQEVQHAEP